MTDFNCSDAGQHAAYACQILAGARTLSEARPSSRYRLLLPMLNLSGHGLELLLKACIYLNGNEPPRFGGRLREGAESYAKALASDILR